MSKEQKSTNKQSTRRKTQNKKKTITINPLLIIIILILIIVLASVIILKKDNKKEKTNQIENNQTEQEIEQEMPEYSTIDMNNTENAKIYGGTKGVARNIRSASHRQYNCHLAEITRGVAPHFSTGRSTGSLRGMAG